MVEAKAISKSYMLGSKRVEVLQGIDLVVQRGEFVAVRGASGAGKSTLLHLIAGLDSPDSGTLRVNAQDLSKSSSDAAAKFRRQAVGVVFQAYHLFPELDALENVCVPARLARREMGATTAKAKQLLDRVGLGHRMDHRPTELSGGEQQRVSIARAMVNDPVLIIADEPTGNLDSKTGDEILELLSSLRRDFGTTLIIATHDQRVASRAQREVEILDGRIAQQIR